MNSAIPNDVALQRIDALERELVSLRTVLAPTAKQTHGQGDYAATDAVAQPAEQTRELLLCRAGEARVALPLAVVREVVPIARLLPLPGAARCVLGTLDLRGTPVVVHDMVAHLTGHCEILESTHLILIAQVNGGLIGIKMTEAEDVVRASVGGVSAARTEGLRSDIVLGVSIHDGSQVMVLDVQAIAARPETQ